MIPSGGGGGGERGREENTVTSVFIVDELCLALEALVYGILNQRSAVVI